MKKSEILARLKNMVAKFSEGDAPPGDGEQVPAEFKSYTLEDGSAVEIDKLEVGGNVQTVDATGATMPSKAAAYTLADGTSISCDDNGVITEVESKSAEQTEDAAGEIATQMAAMKEEFEAAKQNFSASEISTKQELEAVKVQFSEFKKQVNELFNATAETMQAFMEAPAAEPIQKPKNAFSSKEEETQRKREAFLERAKGLGK